MMKNPRRIGIGIAIGGLLTAPLLGILYLAFELVDLPFTPYDLFDWITRVLPGSVITFGIDVMIDALRSFGLGISDTAKIAERTIAVLQILAGGAVVGGIISWLTTDSNRRQALSVSIRVGAFVGVLMSVLSIYIEGSTVSPVLVVIWLTGLFTVWAVVIEFVLYRFSHDVKIGAPEATPESQNMAMGRREFVVKVGASVAVITVASTGIGTLLAQAARRELETATKAASGTSASAVGTTTDPAVVAVANTVPAIERLAFPNAGDPVVPALGTRPELTAVKDHYQVSIRTRPTVIDGSTWALAVSGLVANPVSLTVDDLRRDFEPKNEFVTLSCISGRIATTLISTTQWTGLSVQDLLERVQPDENARYLDISSGDGFHEIVDLNLIRKDERIMLCYAWDGELLTIEHGFPLRIWIPDRYGMKQPRWIESIEVTDKYRAGYWVQRGWDEVARVEPTSVIDTIDGDSLFEVDGQSYVPVGGIAFAGAKEVSKVEVRVNDGPWEEAELRSPLSETTWVIWRYDWKFEPGNHIFQVRCTTGSGTPQAEDVRGNRPSGATGLHSKRAGF